MRQVYGPDFSEPKSDAEVLDLIKNLETGPARDQALNTEITSAELRALADRESADRQALEAVLTYPYLSDQEKSFINHRYGILSPSEAGAAAVAAVEAAVAARNARDKLKVSNKKRKHRAETIEDKRDELPDSLLPEFSTHIGSDFYDTDNAYDYDEDGSANEADDASAMMAVLEDRPDAPLSAATRFEMVELASTLDEYSGKKRHRSGAAPASDACGFSAVTQAAGFSATADHIVGTDVGTEGGAGVSTAVDTNVGTEDGADAVSGCASSAVAELGADKSEEAALNGYDEYIPSDEICPVGNIHYQSLFVRAFRELKALRIASNLKSYHLKQGAGDLSLSRLSSLTGIKGLESLGSLSNLRNPVPAKELIVGRNGRMAYRGSRYAIAPEILQAIKELNREGLSLEQISDQIAARFKVQVSLNRLRSLLRYGLEELWSFRQRELLPCYPVIYVDVVVLRMLTNANLVVEHPFYFIMGMNFKGEAGLLNIDALPRDYEQPGVLARMWHDVLNDLKARGLKDPIYLVSGTIPELRPALSEVFPHAICQQNLLKLIEQAAVSIKTPTDNNDFINNFRHLLSCKNLLECLKQFAVYERRWQGRCVGADESIRQIKDNFVYFEQYYASMPAVRSAIKTTKTLDSFINDVKREIRHDRSYLFCDALHTLSYILEIERYVTQFRRPVQWKRALKCMLEDPYVGKILSRYLDLSEVQLSPRSLKRDQLSQALNESAEAESIRNQSESERNEDLALKQALKAYHQARSNTTGTDGTSLNILSLLAAQDTDQESGTGSSELPTA